ncbi:MAG: transporter [Steroidobacteraceae bacterium]
MSALSGALHQSPELLLFAALALGVWLGRLRVHGVCLGTGCAVLIVAVMLGALLAEPAQLSYPPILKSIAFAVFVFSIGFSSGPQFFASLGRRTLKQAVLAVFLAAVALATTLIVARLFGFGKGLAAGLAAGALTQSTIIGTASGALSAAGFSHDAVQREISNAAIAFALTYIFGTIMVIIFVSQIAPRLMGISLKAQARALEDELAKTTGDVAPSGLTHRGVDARVFVVKQAAGKTVSAVEASFAARVVIERIRRAGRDLEPAAALVLRAGDDVVLAGRRPQMVAAVHVIGPEGARPELLAPINTTSIDAVMIRKEFSGISVREVIARHGDQTHGVFLQAIMRGGQSLPVTLGTQILTGDVLRLAGSGEDLTRVVELVGREVPTSERSDLALLGLGLLIGTMVGLLSVPMAGVPITLGAGGAVLIAGLVCGRYNSRHPLTGSLPAPARRVLWDLGLAMFLGVVGLEAGPKALDALSHTGAAVLLAGAVVTLVPQIATMYFARYVLRMDPVLICGALAGAQTQDAALLAASDAAESSTPILGFTVPYAIGNVMLTLLGPLVIALV